MQPVDWRKRSSQCSHTFRNNKAWKCWKSNRDVIRNAVREVSDSITPYSVSDMDNVVTSQKKLMNDVLAKNALLVSENSELRMHMSFMPVEYRDYVKNLQKSNHQEIAINAKLLKRLFLKMTTRMAVLSKQRTHL
jgi:hypothetical protein